MNNETITLQVNGKEHQVAVSPEVTLLDTLRDELGLFGAREGCGIGMCGACTVLVDGRAISSCLMLAVQAEGRDRHAPVDPSLADHQDMLENPADGAHPASGRRAGQLLHP